MTGIDQTTPEPDACRFVRDEYDEPAPFGSCATHRRALATPDATSCSPEPEEFSRVMDYEPDATVAALDLDAICRRALDATDEDAHFTRLGVLTDDVPALVTEVRALRAEVERMTSLWQGAGVAHFDAVQRAEAAEADLAHLREEYAADRELWREGHVREVAEIERLREELDGSPYERWDSSVPPGGMVCRVCGVPVESEPCMEHNPLAVALARADDADARADEAEAAVARVREVAKKRDVPYPPKFAFTASENYVNGYRAALDTIRAALDGGQR